MELITVWTGASWREAPQPVMIAPPQAALANPPTTRAVWRKSQAGHSQRRRDARALVYACVDNCFCSINAVMDRTGLSDRTVRRILMQGVETGALEKVNQGRIGYTGGYPTYLYRRVAQKAEAAA